MMVDGVGYSYVKQKHRSVWCLLSLPLPLRSRCRCLAWLYFWPLPASYETDRGLRGRTYTFAYSGGGEGVRMAETHNKKTANADRFTIAHTEAVAR